jgi:hypothetical protein
LVDALKKPQILILFSRAAPERGSQGLGVPVGAPFQVAPGDGWKDASGTGVVSMNLPPYKAPLFEELNDRGYSVGIRSNPFYDLDLCGPWFEDYSAQHNVLIGSDAVL